MALQLQVLKVVVLAVPPIPSSSSSSSSSSSIQTLVLHPRSCTLNCKFQGGLWRSPRQRQVLFAGKEETTDELLFGVSVSDDDGVEHNNNEKKKKQQLDDPTPQDLEYVRQIQGVLERLKQNRDMLFTEVKLTIMIEDPREVERRKLLGIDDEDAPSREDLVAALEHVNEGKIPEDRVALQMLAEEMLNWPNLEVEAPKKKSGKSLYAKATDTGVDPQVAAKRLNIDWDSAAEIDEIEESDDAEVPPAVV
ncbi:hypothetical protein Sjap_000048 [Stephania japonica]|uniref:Ycf3-interacting protein 1, chloroplastic n=1 Tax=Stephania japonica TaxID=461633 RepID=A0AAP0KIV9_9MAGN